MQILKVINHEWINTISNALAMYYYQKNKGDEEDVF